MYGLRLDIGVFGQDAVHLPAHFCGHLAIVHFPLLHEDVGHGLLIVLVPHELKAPKRGADHSIDLVWVLADSLLRCAETVLRKFHDVTEKKQLMIAFFLRDDVFRHREQRGIDDSGLQNGITTRGVSRHLKNRNVFPRLQPNLLQSLIREKRR